MTTDVTGHAVDQERPYLLLFMAALGVFGCFVLLAGTVIAPFFVPDYDWVADTISDLAAGQSEIIMDVALYGFAASLMAIALAASHAHLGGVFWSVGVLSFAILATLVVIIGARNEYGDGDNEGVVIHIYLVYGLGVFFTLAPFSMAAGIKEVAPWACRTLITLGVLWVLSAPVFFFLPTGIDGLYERLLGVIAGVMVLVLSAVFWQRGKAALRR
ncbi:MAG: DUF998 domain-containing protein [Pseudomonadota bacterium]